MEADELVTKQFLRAELAELRSELRVELAQALHRQTVWLGGAVAGSTALVLAAIGIRT